MKVTDERIEPSDMQVIVAIYGHWSRVHSSSYATLTTLYIGFVAFFYVVLLPRTFRGNPASAFLVGVFSVLILSAAFLFYLRNRVYTKGIQYIENNVFRVQGKPADKWFIENVFAETSWIDKIALSTLERVGRGFTRSERGLLFLFLASAALALVWIIYFAIYG